jgi:hypothetical protein
METCQGPSAHVVGVTSLNPNQCAIVKLEKIATF